MRINKKLLFIGAGVALLAIIVILFMVFKKKPLEFETQEARSGEIQSSVFASGSLGPTNEVEIGSVVSGIVLDVLVEENDFVKKGQVLARINPESIKTQIARFTSQLESAKAQLSASEATLKNKQWHYERMQATYKETNGKYPSYMDLQTSKNDFISARSDVDIKKAAINEVQMSIKSASIDLKNSIIVSSIDGVVLSRSVEVGQSVAASLQAPKLFIIAENLQEMILKVNVSEADIGKIKENQEVFFSVDAYPNRRFKASVNKVNFGSDTQNNITSYIAKIEVNNKELLLRPGMSANAQIIVAHEKNTLLIPISAIYFNMNKALQKNAPKNPMYSIMKMPDRPKAPTTGQKIVKEAQVWVLENKIPKMRDIEIGITDGQFVQVVSGLSEGVQVITGVKK